MLNLLMLIMLAGAPGQSLGEANNVLPDNARGPTAVTDKDLRPVKLPDCRTDAEVQRTLIQLKNGEPEDCFIRSRTALRR